jgi:NAD(P)-dependent dehydrogenase (short-subunit alcohol dehydrogenase family)
VSLAPERVAVVAGASRGIGLAVTRTLARQGVQVVAGARHPEGHLDGIERVSPIVADVATAAGPGDLVAEAVNRFGRVDYLVNCVGGGIVRSDAAQVTDGEWSEMFERTFMSAVRACRAAIPHMVAAGAGAVVNVSSVSGSFPEPQVIDYCAAKAALHSYSKALALSVAAHGVRVNVVSPGPVVTPLWTDRGGLADQFAEANGVTPAEAMESFARDVLPLKRFAEATEVADLIAYLLSDSAAIITGCDYRIDAGMTPMY